MAFQVKPTKRKEPTAYKTIYLKQSLVDRIEEIAAKNTTSFNNVVVSMIESCLSELDQKDS